MPKEEDKQKEIRLVTFMLGEETFGISIMKVNEIVRIKEIVKLPHAPDFIEGVINLRGNIIPILNIKKKFVMPKAEIEPTSKIVVCDIEEDIKVGLVVDQVKNILNISKDKIEPVPALTTAIMDVKMLEGIVKTDNQLIILLKIDALINHEEKKILLNAKEVI